VLDGVASRFHHDSIKVDKAVFNPSRICKLYGTRACKGDDTIQCPHRMSRILEAPENFEEVPLHLLEAIATPTPVKTQTQNTTPSRTTHTMQVFTMEDFIARYTLPVGPRQDYQGGYKWSLDACPFCQNTNKCAILTQAATGALGFKCLHNSCAEKHWQDYRALYDNHSPFTLQTGATTSGGSVQAQTQTHALIDICKTARYFKTPEGDLCAYVPIKGYNEVHIIGEKGGFRSWLIKRYYDTTGLAANTTAVQQTIELMAARTNEDAPIADLFMRVGYKDNKIYLDMVNADHQAIEIDSQGWRVLDDSPVYFRQSKGMLPLPTPVQGGTIDELRPFLNLACEGDWRMIVAYQLMMLHQTGPYPVLALSGEGGTAKSSTTRFIRSTIDPHNVMTRSAPKDEHDLVIAAKNNRIVAYENLSHIPEWLSDALCRLSTGSGYGTRKLYENDEEQLFNAKRPAIVNGISELVTRGDLLSRTLSISLPVMGKGKYKTEKELDEAFRIAHPRILGAIIDIISTCIRNLPHITTNFSSRMAEMEAWMYAAEEKLGWQSGSFVTSYLENQDTGMDVVLEASQVAKAVMEFIGIQKPSWKGSATDLDTELKNVIAHEFDKKQWPISSKTLSDQLRKISPALRGRNIFVTTGRVGKSRFIELTFGDANNGRGDAETKKGDAGDAESDAVTQTKSLASPPESRNTPVLVQMSDAGDAENTYSSVGEDMNSSVNIKNDAKNGRIEQWGKLASPASPVDVFSDVFTDEKVCIPDTAPPNYRSHCHWTMNWLWNGERWECGTCVERARNRHTYAVKVQMVQPETDTYETELDREIDALPSTAMEEVVYIGGLYAMTDTKIYVWGEAA